MTYKLFAPFNLYRSVFSPPPQKKEEENHAGKKPNHSTIPKSRLTNQPRNKLGSHKINNPKPNRQTAKHPKILNFFPYLYL